MSQSLSQTATEFEELFPEAAILLRMTLQSTIDSYRVDTGASEVNELRAKVTELQQKLSRPKASGKPRGTSAVTHPSKNGRVVL